MLERKQDLFHDLFTLGHLIALSTNGYLKKNGEGVMGRGCALQAAKLYPEFPSALGKHLKEHGNVPAYITVDLHGLAPKFMILPVKHSWEQPADLVLVEKSIAFLGGEAQKFPALAFHVPRLGCGNGRLSWQEQVLPLMQSLPNNCVVHS